MLRDFTVVLQRLIAAGFLVGAGKRHIPNLQQLRRGKKRHIRGVVKKGVAKAPLVYQNTAQSGPLGLDSAGQAGWAGPHDQNVKVFLYTTAARLHLYSLDDEKPLSYPW